MRDLAVVALEEVLADDLPVRLDLGLPARVVDERVDVEPELRDLRGQRAERLRERLGRRRSAFAKTNGPHVSTATGTRPSSSCGKSGSSSLRGAARRRPSRPYVQAWYGHCSVSRLCSPSATREAAVAADVDEAAQDAVAVARDDDGRPADLRGEVAGLRELSRVADVLPRGAEDPLLLAPQDLGIRVPAVRQRRLHGASVRRTWPSSGQQLPDMSAVSDT